MHLQEIIFSSNDPGTSTAISKLEKDGRIRKIAARVYTPNLEEDPAAIVRRNVFKIVGKLYPGIMLSHRSALEYNPTSSGDLFLTYTQDRKIKLPGVTLNMFKGPGPANRCSSKKALGT